MGFHVHGEFTITKSVLSETEFVLCFDRFLTSLGGNYYQLADFHKEPSDTLFEGACRVGGWMLFDRTTEADDRTSYIYGVNQRWAGNYIENFFRYCASVGMIVKGEFVAGVNDTWGYYTDVATRKLRIISYPQVDLKVMAKMKQDIKTLWEIRSIYQVSLKLKETFKQIKAKFSATLVNS